MIFTTLLLALPGLFQVASSRNVPTPIRGRSVQVAAAPAMPTSDLVSDFKKNNVSAKWAEGHPMQWGTEDKKYTYPIPLEAYDFAAAVSPDEKYLVMINTTGSKVVSLDTGAVTSNPTFSYQGSGDRVILVSAANNQYDIIRSASNYSSRTDRVSRIRLGQDGKPTGDVAEYDGRFSSFEAWPFNNDTTRMLTQTDTSVYIYSRSNPSSNLTLTGFTDMVVNEVFSPDGAYVSTASWDGNGRLYDAHTGALVHTFGPLNGQSWITRFSPDGKSVLVTTNYRAIVNIWSLGNSTAAPLSLGPYDSWVRSARWSPDGSLLALGLSGEMFIYRVADMAVVQHWAMEDRGSSEINNMQWLEGGKRLTYRIVGGGVELYDFETNLKYRWGPGDLDHYGGGSVEGSTFVLEKRGWIGGVDSDLKVRFWKYPA
ncbi:WD40 repeat-like protein [Polyplosphaeria fusca]|uniref:WD40 repeat-like protein n=1 Tax=Polyplosphaeria fusca TaxID=682080 RepID=A0A9P4QQN4_9PLEO|nr:WD40 repeat-like protein [Polyplosphaeria fusca]